MSLSVVVRTEKRKGVAMDLVRLIYCSRFADRMEAGKLKAIIDAARANNPALGITGILCYGPGVFLQCLEGPRRSVNDMFGRILRDDRNKDVTLLEYAECSGRAFGQWDMAYVRAEDLASGAAGEFAAGGQFDPFAMTAAQALGFCKALLDHKSRFR